MESAKSRLTWTDIVPFLAVAFFWGCTNPLISASVANANSHKQQKVSFSPRSLTHAILNRSYLLWTGVNRIGSVLYVYLLGIYPAAFANIWANSLTVVTTFGMEKIINKQSICARECCGVIMIMFGVALMLLQSSQND